MSPQLVQMYRLSLFLISVIIFLTGRFLLILLRGLNLRRKALEVVVYSPSLIISLIGIYMAYVTGNRRELLLFSLISLYYLVRYHGILGRWAG